MFLRGKPPRMQTAGHVPFSPFGTLYIYSTLFSLHTAISVRSLRLYLDQSVPRSLRVSISLSLSSMEENSDLPETETTAGILAGKLNELLTEVDCSDDMSSEFFIKEEMVAEVMQELYKEITSTSTSTSPNKRPKDSPSPTLSSSSLSSSSSFASTVPFAVCNGKSESCGTSVSDPASTLMAGIEYLGAAAEMGSPENGFCGAVDDHQEAGGCNFRVGANELGFGESQVDGCDVGELDDEWLGRILSWDPSLLEDHCI